MTITIKEVTTPITEMTAGILHCLAYKVPAEMGPTIVEWTQQLWTRPQQCEKCKTVLYMHCAFLNVYILVFGRFSVILDSKTALDRRFIGIWCHTESR